MIPGGGSGNIRRLATYMTVHDNASDTLDSVESKGDETSESMEQVEESSEGVSSGFDSVDRAGVALSATLVGTGVALQGVLDRTTELRGSLALTAGIMDDVDGSIEALATSMSNATFETQDVVRTMEELRQLGIETEEEMENVALAADQIADATGSSASVIAGTLAPSIQALDGDLEAIEDRSDAFTLALNDSRLQAQDLNSVVQRSSQELQDLGLTSDETAGLISMYAQTNQVDGTIAARRFNEAIRESNGDLTALKEELNLSEDALDEWNEKVIENEGETERLAEEVAETKTVMDELRVVASDLQLRFGGVLQPLSALPPALFAAGSAGMFYSTVLTSSAVPATVASTTAHTANTAALTAKTIATRAATGAQTLMTMSTRNLAAATWAKTTALGSSAAAMLAGASAAGVKTAALGALTTGFGAATAGALALWASLGPIGWIALGTAGAVAALAAVARTDLFGSASRASAILDRLRGGLETTGAAARELGGIVYELARITATAGGLALLAPFAALLRLPDLITGIGPRVANAAGNIPSAIVSGLDRLGPAQYALPIVGPLLLARDAVTDPGRWVSAGREIPSMIANGIRDSASEPVDAVTGVASGVRDRLPFSPAAAGPLTDLHETGPALVSTVAGGVESEGGTLAAAMESTLGQTPLGQAAGAAAGAVGDAVGGNGGGGGGTNVEVTIEEINAGGEGSSEENIRAAGGDVANTVIEEIVDALSRENDFSPT